MGFFMPVRLETPASLYFVNFHHFYSYKVYVQCIYNLTAQECIYNLTAQEFIYNLTAQECIYNLTAQECIYNLTA